VKTLTLESMPPGQKCQAPYCDNLATDIAQGRGERAALPLGFYCDAHAEIASEQQSPEYVESCPNCGCRFGVN
jgi:hypothetical protein